MIPNLAPMASARSLIPRIPNASRRSGALAAKPFPSSLDFEFCPDRVAMPANVYVMSARMALGIIYRLLGYPCDFPLCYRRQCPAAAVRRRRHDP